MAKKQAGPYDQYDDLQLLLRYNKLEEDFANFIDIPRWAGVEVPFDKSQTAAEKIDKICAELYLRGLTGPNGQESSCSPEDRAKNVKLALGSLKLSMGQGPKASDFVGGENPCCCTALTPKSKALRPWADPSIAGKWSIFFGHARQEEIDAATAGIAEKYETIRKASADADNAMILSLKVKHESEPSADGGVAGHLLGVQPPASDVAVGGGLPPTGVHATEGSGEVVGGGGDTGGTAEVLPEHGGGPA